MKKIFMTMALIFSILVSGTAFAVNTGEYAKGLLIPITEHNYGLTDTVVGLICSENQEVYWTFFDKDSNPVVDGKFICSVDDFVPWSFNHEVLNVGKGEGYLVFTADDIEKPKNDWILDKGPERIAANAFLIDAGCDDAVYLPVIPLNYSDYKSGQNLRLMSRDTIKDLSNGIRFACNYTPDREPRTTDTRCSTECGEAGTESLTTTCNCYVDARYWTNPKYDASTKIIIWSTDCLRDTLKDHPMCYYDEEKKATFCHVLVYGPDEERVSLSVPMGCEVTVIDPEDIVGFGSFDEGFIRFNRSLLGTGAVVFSYVNSGTMKARQTLMGVENCEVRYED